MYCVLVIVIFWPFQFLVLHFQLITQKYLILNIFTCIFICLSKIMGLISGDLLTRYLQKNKQHVHTSFIFF